MAALNRIEPDGDFPGDGHGLIVIGLSYVHQPVNGQSMGTLRQLESMPRKFDDGGRMSAYNCDQRNLTIAHTLGHANCPACAGAQNVIYRSLSADLLFTEAFKVWISHRVIETNGLRTNASYLSRKTERDYRVCAKALNKFFARLRLGDIHVGHLMAYQNARAICDRSAGDWARPAGANCIRKEVALMIRILKGAKLWGDEQEEHFIRLRPEESEMERAMTIEEQHRFLHVAASRVEFRYVYQYSIVALQTTASTNEMRALRLGDILLDDRVIQIPRAGAKNKYRVRTIPLVTADAVWAMAGLMTRAREMGSFAPSHFLFPFQPSRTHYDPTRPMSESGMKKPWDAVRCAAGLPRLRLYDLRHTGITRMAEAGVPLRVAMTFAGHMTEQMQRRYEAICMSAKRGWGEAVWGRGADGAAIREAAEAAISGPAEVGPPRRPVGSVSPAGNQSEQHFHIRA